MFERDSLAFKTARQLVSKKYRPAARRALYDLQDLLSFSISNLYHYGELDMFQQVCFESNTACNYNKCPYCPNSVVTRGNHEMSDGVYQAMVSQLSGVGHGFRGMFAPVFFNEPTMMGSRLADMMAYARRHIPHAKIQIYTNGILLTKGFYDSLVKAGVDKFLITRHPGAPTENVDYLLSELPDHEIKERIIYRTLDGVKLWQRPPIEIPEDRVLRLERCPMPSSQLTIDYRGDVIFCCNHPNNPDEISLGNIMTAYIPTIWRNKAFKRFREDVRRGIFTLDICQSCVSEGLKH